MIQIKNIPFTYKDLLSIIKDNSLNLHLSMGNLRTKGKFTFNQQNSIFVLVDGGWLPLFLLNYEVNLLLDSNIIGVLGAISKNNQESATIQAGWILQLSNITSPNIFFNPLPYALEGNLFEVPTLQKIKELFSMALDKIKAVIPDANVIHYRDEQFEIAYELIKDIMERNKQDSEFLVKSAPLITQNRSPQDIPQVQHQILEIAKKLDIKLTSSLPFLTVLSCLYEGGQSPFPTARKVLKPRTKYTKENAYNVIADFNTVKFLTGMLALQKRNSGLMPTAFCTRDKALALLWCGFDFRNSDSEIEQTHYSLNENLFPRLDKKLRDHLIEILAE